MTIQLVVAMTCVYAVALVAAIVGLVTLLGAPRDYLYAAKRPQWMVFAPGVVPFLADAAAYLGMVAIGHAVMRLVAGPAIADRLAERRKQAA